VTTRLRHTQTEPVRRRCNAEDQSDVEIEKMCRLARTDHVEDVHEPETECPELPCIHLLADGELVGCEAARAHSHLAECARCRAELAFLMQLAVAVARGVTAIGSPS
jgi:hypothetical protein